MIHSSKSLGDVLVSGGSFNSWCLVVSVYDGSICGETAGIGSGTAEGTGVGGWKVGDG